MDDKYQLDNYERLQDPARVLALSDGVFAIILTLLVLEIHVPDLAQGQTLVDAGREIRPSFIAFLISFVVVAISWAGHRDLFSLIRRTDRALVWLNLLYLLPLSALPFGASLISRYEKDPIALRMFGFLLIVITVTRLIIWLYATGRPRLLVAPLDNRSRWTWVAVSVVAGAAYGIAIVIATTHPAVSLAIYAAIPISYFIGIVVAGKTALPESA